jgi:tetratricopeptide (TPR) repeat protein
MSEAGRAIESQPEMGAEPRQHPEEIPWRKFKSGDHAGGVADLETLLASGVDGPELRLRYGQMLAALMDPRAEEELRRAHEMDPGAAHILVAMAGLLAGQRRWAAAAETFERALALDSANLWGLVGLADVRARQKRHPEAFALFDKALRVAPENAKVAARYSKALLDRSLYLAEYALERDPHSARARVVMSRAQRAFGPAQAPSAHPARSAPDAGPSGALAAPTARARPTQGRPAIFPRAIKSFEDLERVVRTYVLPGSRPDAPVLGPSTQVATFGSCFAEHIAAALRECGMDVFFQKRSETMDNLVASRRFLDWIVGDDAASPYFNSAPEREGYASRFAKTEVFILSLGVAAAYFDRHTGEFALIGAQERGLVADKYEFRMMSVEENAAHLSQIIRNLRRLNPECRIVLTVSPVPLAGTFDRLSAVQADAVSKSTLRATVEAVMNRDIEGVHYWPSFEIVRWMGTYLPPTSPPAFGADDGVTRHVSSWLVRMIIRLFLEYFGTEDVVQSLAAARSQAAGHAGDASTPVG